MNRRRPAASGQAIFDQAEAEANGIRPSATTPRADHDPWRITTTTVPAVITGTRKTTRLVAEPCDTERKTRMPNEDTPLKAATDEIRDTGERIFPEVAELYSKAASFMWDAENERQLCQFGDGSYNVIHGYLKEFRSEVYGILTQSGTNMKDVGAALVAIANEYESMDAANAASLKNAASDL
ncbi:MAG: hypothetical protein ACRD0P_23220 [Stackebrandtia sp.]